MIYFKFLWSLFRHKWFVFRAGLWTGVPLWRLIIHDWSKFSPSELGAYARNFQGDYSSSPNDREKVSLEYTHAWLHHENTNKHHWGHYIPRTGKHANKPLSMPETYVRELVADCHGAGRAYTGQWDVSAWMNEHWNSWNIHGDTLRLIGAVMVEIGYLFDTDLQWNTNERFKAK